MTDKILRGNYPGGYQLAKPLTDLSIATTGFVGGEGVVSGAIAAYRVSNSGTIEASGSTTYSGVSLNDGGLIVNGADGYRGVILQGEDDGVVVRGQTGTVENLGQILSVGTTYGQAASASGVYLVEGGKVINGTADYRGAIIAGHVGIGMAAAGKVRNYATIEGVGAGGAGLELHAGGRVVNGGTSDSTALVEGASGAVADANLTVVNFGTVLGTLASAGYSRTTVSDANAAIALLDGGAVTNGSGAEGAALLAGQEGVSIKGASGHVLNYGTIESSGTLALVGIYLADGGSVINGSAAATLARRPAKIAGYGEGVLAAGGTATVINFGTITAAQLILRDTITGFGVVLNGGGRITNGGQDDTTALIQGAQGGVIMGVPGIVSNFGTILGGELMYGGGTVTNGAHGDTSALIYGRIAVRDLGAPSTVRNFGSIHGNYGVAINGGVVVNAGSSASIYGSREGVYSSMAAGTVLNQGTISNSLSYQARFGVYLADGGEVINGWDGAAGAVITGLSQYATGVYIKGAAGTIENFGLIADGFTLRNGGTVINGGVADTSAVIEGLYRAGSVSGGVLRNFGTIRQTSNTYGRAIDFSFDGVITNGAASDPAALLQGYYAAIYAFDGRQTVTNFGTIRATTTVAGYSFAAVMLENQGVVTNQAGALIEGYSAIIAGPTQYYFGGPTSVINFGTIEATGAAGYAVEFEGPNSVLTVGAGSEIIGAVAGDGGRLDLAIGATMSSASFDGFGVVEIGSGARFTLTGSGTIGAGSVAMIGGLGTLVLDSAAVSIDVGAKVASRNMTLTGGATVNVDADFAYAGNWDQSAATVDIATGDTLKLSGLSQLTGTVGGGGTLELTGSGDALVNVDLAVARTDLFVASAILNGTVAVTGVLAVISKNLGVVGTTTVAGGGVIELSDSSSNRVTGTGSNCVLDNLGDTIEGAGQIGGFGLTFNNLAGGIVDGDKSGGLTIDTGANQVANQGLIEATISGAVLIKSSVANSGMLAALGGDLTVEGAISGAGTVSIEGATAAFASTFSENVVFINKGELHLGDSVGYGGVISGFSKSGATSLDLEDIGFGVATVATFSGTTASGVLTVTDGTHTAKIKLTGDYLGSSWTVSSDGHGGTSVVDPTVASAAALAAQLSVLGAAAPATASAAVATAHPLPTLVAGHT